MDLKKIEQRLEEARTFVKSFNKEDHSLETIEKEFKSFFIFVYHAGFSDGLVAATRKESAPFSEDDCL